MQFLYRKLHFFFYSKNIYCFSSLSDYTLLMFHNNTVKISEILNKRNLLKSASKLPFLSIFVYFAAIFAMGIKNIMVKTNDLNLKWFCSKSC